MAERSKATDSNYCDICSSLRAQVQILLPSVFIVFFNRIDFGHSIMMIMMNTESTLKYNGNICFL
jgi:hypothetical protein